MLFGHIFFCLSPVAWKRTFSRQLLRFLGFKVFRSYVLWTEVKYWLGEVRLVQHIMFICCISPLKKRSGQWKPVWTGQEVQARDDLSPKKMEYNAEKHKICVQKAQNMWPKHANMCPKSMKYVSEKHRICGRKICGWISCCPFWRPPTLT